MLEWASCTYSTLAKGTDEQERSKQRNTVGWSVYLVKFLSGHIELSIGLKPSLQNTLVNAQWQKPLYTIQFDLNVKGAYSNFRWNFQKLGNWTFAKFVCKAHLVHSMSFFSSLNVSHCAIMDDSYTCTVVRTLQARNSCPELCLFFLLASHGLIPSCIRLPISK